MSSNVLLSALAYEQTETQTTLYPVLPTQPDNNFRMQKANEVLKYLSDEVSHYRLVAKKYKRTKTIINYASFSSGGISGFLSAGGVAAAFTGIGLPAALPIGCVASLFGLPAAGLTGFYKKLEPKLIKHCKIMTILSTAYCQNHLLTAKSAMLNFKASLMKKRAIEFRRRFFGKAHFQRKKINRAALTLKKYDKRPFKKKECACKKSFLAVSATFRNKISVEAHTLSLY